MFLVIVAEEAMLMIEQVSEMSQYTAISMNMSMQPLMKSPVEYQFSDSRAPRVVVYDWRVPVNWNPIILRIGSLIITDAVWLRR